MRFFALFFFIFISVSRCFSDVPLNIRYLGIDDGLSNNFVRCIYQDQKGFIWLGTRDGINRYDGYKFKAFRHKINDPTSLVHNIIHAISSDRYHRLWIGTRQGISIYNGLSDKFMTLPYRSAKTGKISLVSAVIRDIKNDFDGNVLVASEGLGLLYYKKGKLLAEQVPLFSSKGISTDYGIQSIQVGKDKEVWLFVQNLGLCYLDYKKMQVVPVSTMISLAFCMKVDDDKLYIGTAEGLYRYSIKAGLMESFSKDKKLGSSPISSLTIDEKHQLLIGTMNKGIYSINLKNEESEIVPYADNKNLQGIGSIYAVYIDKQSRKWIGTSIAGLGLIDPNRNGFQTIRKLGAENALADNATSAFYQDHNGDLWIGTENSGIKIWNRASNNFKSLKNIRGNEQSLSDNSITSIFSDYKKKVWVGTFSKGLNCISTSTGEVKRYKCLNPNTGIESKVVFTLFEDSKKNFWAGTLRRGTLLGALYKFNRLNDTFGLFDTRLTDLFTLGEDRKGDLWGGNLSQLIKIDTIFKKHRFFDVGFTIRSIYDDAAGNLWIGTEGGGLLVFDRKTERISERYTTDHGLCNNSILTLVDDLHGNLWMSTYNGVSKLEIEKRTFKNYYQSDGLQSNQFQINAGLRLKSGEVVFGGVKGLSIFNPVNILPVKGIPNLFITDIKINNIPIENHTAYISRTSADLIREIQVPYEQAVFSFEFTALEYSSPDKISYRYYMEGWDRNWNDADHVRSATYTHISEGVYTFRVKSTNAEGIWSNKEVAIKIIVLPPWYRTLWAYLFYGSIFLSLTYLFLRYKNKQTKLQYEVQLVNLDSQRKKAEYETAAALYQKEKAEHEKEKVVNEKEKELNEKRLSFFTNISHEFRSPLSLIINPVKDLIEKSVAHCTDDKVELNIIHRNAKRMLSLVNQLLLFRKADLENDSIVASRLNVFDICQEVYLCFTQQAFSKKINFDLISENKELFFFADREKIEIILFNLLSNALKYTPASGTVKLIITEEKSSISISVKDNGSGIAESEGEQIFQRFYQGGNKNGTAKPGFGIGLYLARQFAHAHSGELSYISVANSGTTFNLRLLKGTDHLEDVYDGNFNQESKLLSELVADDFIYEESFSEQLFEEENIIISEKQSILIVDDESEIRSYIRSLFKEAYNIYEAKDGESGLSIAFEKMPDLIITDYKMQQLDGIELCEKIKADPTLSYIPIILLTASSSKELKIKSLKGGADDYINKPFEKEYLIARVENLLRNRNNLQNYFYNEITLQKNSIVISEEYKKFLDKCIMIVEEHLNDPDFGIKALASEIGMSHSNLYKRVKSISGQSVSSFIRFIKLRKAAELMINSDCNVNEAAFRSGFNDARYFGKQFLKLFRLNPSEFIKKHRKSFNNRFKIK